MTHPVPRRPNCERAKQGVCKCRCIGTGHGLARLREVREAQSRAELLNKRDPHLHLHKRLRQERELLIAAVERKRERVSEERRQDRTHEQGQGPRKRAAATQTDRRVLHELALAELAIYLYDHRIDMHTLAESREPTDLAGHTAASAQRAGEVAPHRLISSVVDYQAAQAAVDLLANVELIATIFSSEVPGCLHDHLGLTEKEREQRRKELSNTHFWCSLLAALATALDLIAGPWAQVSDRVRTFVIDSLWERMPRRGKRGGIGEWLQRKLLTVLVNAAWQFVDRAATVGLSLPDFHQAIRVLGVISCPDLDGHPDVVECCLVPLVNEFVDTDVRRYIIDELCIAYPALNDVMRRYGLGIDTDGSVNEVS